MNEEIEKICQIYDGKITELRKYFENKIKNVQDNLEKNTSEIIQNNKLLIQKEVKEILDKKNEDINTLIDEHRQVTFLIFNLGF